MTMNRNHRMAGLCHYQLVPLQANRQKGKTGFGEMLRKKSNASEGCQT